MNHDDNQSVDSTIKNKGIFPGLPGSLLLFHQSKIKHFCNTVHYYTWIRILNMYQIESGINWDFWIRIQVSRRKKLSSCFGELEASPRTRPFKEV
jgi:hypothetical protein